MIESERHHIVAAAFIYVLLRQRSKVKLYFGIHFGVKGKSYRMKKKDKSKHRFI